MNAVTRTSFAQYKESDLLEINRANTAMGGRSTCSLCIGNGQRDIASRITVELAQTLSTMHDQLIVVIYEASEDCDLVVLIDENDRNDSGSSYPEN